VKPVLSTMIRVGPPSTRRVSTLLNPFHSQAVAESGFYVNVAGGSQPPPTSITTFASQYTSAPWLRVLGTIFVDPYGFTVVPKTVSTFYMEVKNMVPNGFSLFWANNYDGTANAILPYGPLVNVVNSEAGDSVYFRLNNKGKAFRMFWNEVPDGLTIVIVGPENISKVAVAFNVATMDGLEGIRASLFFVNNSGGRPLVVSKEDESPFVVVKGSPFTEYGLSGSSPRTPFSITFWVFK